MSAIMSTADTEPRRKKTGQSISTCITDQLRDLRWQDVGRPGQVDLCLRLPNDTRLLIWGEDDGSYNVGALQGDRAVWDHLHGPTGPELEQAALDCWTALALLESVRAIPTEWTPSARMRRKVRRMLIRTVLRNVLAWGLVVIGVMMGVALCALWTLRLMMGL